MAAVVVYNRIPRTLPIALLECDTKGRKEMWDAAVGETPHRRGRCGYERRDDTAVGRAPHRRGCSARDRSHDCHSLCFDYRHHSHHHRSHHHYQTFCRRCFYNVNRCLIATHFEMQTWTTSSSLFLYPPLRGLVAQPEQWMNLNF
jgi:hypothetical protein